MFEVRRSRFAVGQLSFEVFGKIRRLLMRCGGRAILHASQLTLGACGSESGNDTSTSSTPTPTPTRVSTVIHHRSTPRPTARQSRPKRPLLAAKVRHKRSTMRRPRRLSVQMTRSSGSTATLGSITCPVNDGTATQKMASICASKPLTPRATAKQKTASSPFRQLLDIA